MKRVATITIAVFALFASTAQAAWDKNSVTVDPNSTETVRGHWYPQNALLQDWVKVDGKKAERTRLSDAAFGEQIFKTKGVRIIAAYRANSNRVVYRAANFTQNEVTVTIGSKATGSF